MSASCEGALVAGVSVLALVAGLAFAAPARAEEAGANGGRDPAKPIEAAHAMAVPTPLRQEDMPGPRAPPERALEELPAVTLLAPVRPGESSKPKEPEPDSGAGRATGGIAFPEANKALEALLEARADLDAGSPRASTRRKEREAIAAFYLGRNFAPLWFSEGKPNSAVASVIARLEKAGEDGLDLSAYPLRPPRGETPEETAAADIALTDAVVAYGRQATGSRIDPRTISSLIAEKPEVADAALILANVATARDAAGDVLRGYNPHHRAYRALRDKLAQVRRTHAPSARELSVPTGPVLRVGMRDSRVPIIRARLSLDGDRAAGPDASLYDARIAAAVADFQKANGLPNSGVLTARTAAALSGRRPAGLEAEILANMERWRWMPQELGETRIEVNIPSFEAVVVENGAVIERHRVIVGKTETPTPVFSDTMQFLIVNPYWNVPRSILRKELSPDPSHLRRLGYEVFSRDGHLVVRQPPGERNALGRIKFMFPNDYSVYMHDTPKHELFAEDRRAFSHGCVRVDDPFRFAETVLGNGWSEQRIRKLIGGKERYVHLQRPLPIHIGYFTAFVDESGSLQTREDLYGYSRRVRVALGLES